MTLIEVVFKIKEKEIVIKCSENENVYEVFNRSKKFINDNLNEFKLYFGGKLIEKEILIKDLLSEKYDNKIFIIIKPIINSINLKYKLSNQSSEISLFKKKK